MHETRSGPTAELPARFWLDILARLARLLPIILAGPLAVRYHGMDVALRRAPPRVGQDPSLRDFLDDLSNVVDRGDIHVEHLVRRVGVFNVKMQGALRACDPGFAYTEDCLGGFHSDGSAAADLDMRGATHGWFCFSCSRAYQRGRCWLRGRG
jgi:hypothetical protein